MISLASTLSRSCIPYAKQVQLSTLSLVNHKLNCEKALKKSNEGNSFKQLQTGSIDILQGVGPVHLETFEKLGIRSINDLANYKFFQMARAITILADSAEGDFRPKDSSMNINKAVDKAYEKQSIREIRDAPVASLQGLSDEKGEILGKIGVHSVGDLANLKYFQWAEAITEMSKYEE